MSSTTGLGEVAPLSLTKPEAAPAIRAQLLATEHWSLLATRGMTWSEVMSRISIHLTVLSASLVVLALVAQASGFGTPFMVLSIGLASAVLVLGTLTGIRVANASLDDHGLVIGLNRLRAAYLAMDPSLADYLVTSAHDDRAGVMHTYTIGHYRHPVSHIVGSTNMFMNAVAFSGLRLMQPCETLSTPWSPTDHGAACTYSPLSEMCTFWYTNSS